MNHQITYLLLLTGIVFLVMGVYSYSQGATVDIDKLPIANVTEIREESLNENVTHLNETIVKSNPVYNPENDTKKTDKSNKTIEDNNTADFEEITDPTAYELAQQKQYEEESLRDVSEDESTEESTVSEAENIVKKVNKTIPRKEYGFFKKKASFVTDEYYIYKTDKNGKLDLGGENGGKEFIVIPVE